MVAETVGNERLGSAYGLIQSLDSAGAIAGPLVALALLARCGIRCVFWAAAVPGAMAVLVSWLGIREKRRAAIETSTVSAREDNHPQLPGGVKTRVSLPASFYLVLVAVTLFSIGNSSDMFLVMRAQNLGIAVKLAPLLGLVFNITYTLGSWPAGWLSDRASRGFSRRGIAAAGYVIFAGVYFVFARATSTRAIWISMAVYGLYYALTQPVLKALVVETVDSSSRGRALGVYFFATSVATLAASLITGELWKIFGASIPFYLSSGMAAASAALLMISGMGMKINR